MLKISVKYQFCGASGMGDSLTDILVPEIDMCLLIKK
jgi:hypothetical protein